jgi:hypothetical protein
MARRRRVFGQRRSFRRRVLTGAATVLVVVVATLLAVYFTLPWTAGFAAERLLAARGWAPARIHFARLDLGGIEIDDLALANNTITLKRLAVSYSLVDLARRQVREIALTGLRLNLHWGADGLRLGPLDLGGPSAARPPAERRSGPAPPRGPIVQKITVADASVALPAGRTTLVTAVAADLAAQEERWDGVVTLETRASEAAAPVLRLAWEGALAPAAPTRWRSRASLDLRADDLTLADGVTVSGRGHLDIETGDGRFALRGADRLALNIAAVPDAAPNELPPALARLLKAGVAVYLGGGRGGPVLSSTVADGVQSYAADVDLGVSTGETWAGLTFRGGIAGPAGQIPETVTVADLRLSGRRVPTPFGEVGGRVRVTRVDGPLTSFEGDAAADATITKPTMELVSAAAARLNTRGHFRLDGFSLAYEPAQLALSVDDAQALGLSAPGRFAATILSGSKEPQSITVVTGGDGRTTVTFGLTAATPAIPISRPGEGGSMASLDLPRLRIEGYVTPGSGRYEVKLRSDEGTFAHPFADARLAKVSARMVPGGATADGTVILTRLVGRVSRVRGTEDAGLRLVWNLRKDIGHIVTSADFKAASGKDVGRFRSDFDPAADSGNVSLEVPRLDLGAAGVPARDLFTASFPVAGLTGAVAVSLKGAWRAGRMDGSGHVELGDVGFQSALLSLSGLNCTLDLDQLWPPRAAAPMRLSAVAGSLGLPFRDLAVEAGLPGDGTLAIRQGAAVVAGGRLAVGDLVLPLDGRDGRGTLRLERIDLAAVAAQAKVEGLAMTGRMSGTLPLRTENGAWTIAEGKLASEGPGTVAFRPASPPAALAGGGEVVLKALSDFGYDSIAATISGPVLKDLSLRVAMKGRNSALYGSAPIAFNLTLGGPLGAILRQGIAGYRLDADTMDRIKNAGGPQ